MSHGTTTETGLYTMMKLWVHYWSKRLCINGTQSREMGLCDLGSCTGLFGLGRATAVARRQVFGSLDLRKHDVSNEHSQAFVFVLW